MTGMVTDLQLPMQELKQVFCCEEGFLFVFYLFSFE